MLATGDILRIAYDETDDPPVDFDAFAQRVNKQLDSREIPPFSDESKPLDLVSFRCFLQDTGYPLEVYLPGTDLDPRLEPDSTKLRERWVGWATQIPGEQSWVPSRSASRGNRPLPQATHSKFPLTDVAGSCLGAVVKLYDGSTPGPASTHEYLGIVSSAHLAQQDEVIVPAIHVIDTVKTVPPCEHGLREELVDYLATSFQPPDRLAGELLLLALISHPVIRQPGMSPIGTLSIQFARSDPVATARLEEVVASVSPRVVRVPLSARLLETSSFMPHADDVGLRAGMLQLAEATVLIVSEDGLVDGDRLDDKAVKNLKSLIECVKDQSVRYDYPYMDDLRINCAVRAIVLGEGKSVLPVDVRLPLASDPPQTPLHAPDLNRFREYLATRSPNFAASFTIPDEMAIRVQDDFVKRRRAGDSSGEDLKRWMRLARLMALSTAEATLTKDLWQKTLNLDARIVSRQS